MDATLWTPDAIAHARWATGWYDFAALWISILTAPVLLVGLLVLYAVTMNRIFLFFLPSSMFIAGMVGYGAIAYLTYFGLSIDLLGLHMNIPRVLPPTCDAATVLFGPENLPCQARELRDWALGGHSFEPEVPVKFMGRYGVLILLVVVVGLAMMQWCILIPRCKICGHRLKRVLPNVAGLKNMRCYRCWDPELALKGAHVNEKGGLV